MVKVAILFGFILVIFNLANGLFHLVSKKGNSKKLLKALAFRVLFSILIFLLIISAHFFGYIEPTGINLTS
jgi:hypothetical protein